ncbi:MAG: AI-2E family transporter, partial [Oscillospiraceae bacterium]|nr:AI-2E family transporter [Oscillospiraceae bacterium]
MNGKFNTDRFKSLRPIFFLALAIIVAWKVLGNLNFFGGLISQAWTIVTPFFYGFLLAYILNIPRSGLERLFGKIKLRFFVKRKRMLSIVTVYLLLVLILVLILNWVIPALVTGIDHFITNFSAHYDNLLQVVNQINNLDILGLHIDETQISDAARNWVQSLGLGDILSQVGTIIDVSTAIFGGLFVGFLALISSVYILFEKDRFKAFLQRLLSAFTSGKIATSITEHVGMLNLNFRRYIFTQTIDGMIMGTMAALVLWLIIGSPYALILGIMLGIVNYVPYFGSIIGTLVAVLIVAFTQGMGSGLLAAALLLVAQQIDANIIQPRLMSGSFSLSPLLVIISITVGGAIAGIFGMIAAIPI